MAKDFVSKRVDEAEKNAKKAKDDMPGVGIKILNAIERATSSRPADTVRKEQDEKYSEASKKLEYAEKEAARLKKYDEDTKSDRGSRSNIIPSFKAGGKVKPRGNGCAVKGHGKGKFR